MKQNIVLLLATLLLGGIAQAQVTKESFEKAVDFLNCKSVELTLPQENIQQYQQDCPCNETNFTQINKFLTSAGKLDATIALSNEIEALKKSFIGNWKKDEAVTFLSESIFADNKYQRIVAFAERRKGKTEFDNYKASLKTELRNILVESVSQEIASTTNTSVQQASLEDRISVLEINQGKTDKRGFLGGLADYLILFAILLGAVALLLSLKKPSVETIYDTLINKLIGSQRMNNHFHSQNSFRSTSRNSVSSSELKDSNNRIRDLESQIEQIKKQLSNPNSTSNHTTQEPVQETKQPEVKIETFFLSTPNSDGSFNESSVKSTYQDGATIYRFTKSGGNRAKFQIDEKESSTKLALQYPDKNIDPVCDAVNAYNPKATRIVTEQQGEAELQNDKWIINAKAKIRYEN